MGLADHARLVIDYNEDANLRVLEQALSLDDDALHRDAGASQGSILGNLQHVVSAQGIWLSRWTGERSNVDQNPGRVELAAAFDASHIALRTFAAPLDDADWDRVIDYRDMKGVPHSVPLGALVTHLVNHGTLHRGEAGMLLAAYGRSPEAISTSCCSYWTGGRAARSPRPAPRRSPRSVRGSSADGAESRATPFRRGR